MEWLVSLESHRISSIICNICEKNVTLVDRQDKGNESRWICVKCKEKYPTWN